MPATTTKTWTITLTTSSHSDPESESHTIDEDTLDALNITLVARLSLPRLDSAKSHITAHSNSLGTDAFMSPERFHAHLQMLATMVPWTDGTWIDAFFFRAAAMVPPSHYLIMSAEQTLTHTASLYPKDGNAGIGKYVLSNFETCVGAAHKLHEISDGFPPEGFFLTQGKQSMLGDDVPRALCDMYAVAERTKQPILRGALTNGRDWIFLILSRNSDGRGATYKESAIISLIDRKGFSKHRIVEPWPDVIALLLTTWVPTMLHRFQWARGLVHSQLALKMFLLGHLSFRGVL